MADSNTGGMFSKLINPETAQPKKKVEEATPVAANNEESMLSQSPTFTPKTIEEKVITIKTPQSTTRVKEIRVTLPLPTDLLSFLDQMERDVFIRRSAKYRSKQRLTKNSIARAWLALLRHLKININNVEDEADLLERLRKAVDEYHII